jgi:hypothetical protein
MSLLAPSYTWIFSGIGVWALGVVVWFVKRALRSRNPPANMQQNSLSLTGSKIVGSTVAVGSNISLSVHQGPVHTAIRDRSPIGPTPAEVASHERSLPPYQQKFVMQHYVGLPVALAVRFLTVDYVQRINEPGTWMAMFEFTEYRDNGDIKQNHHIFSCFPDIERFPRLKTLPKNAWIWLEGKIGESPNFNVAPDKMEFE